MRVAMPPILCTLSYHSTHTFDSRLIHGMQRYASQNWVYHLISNTNHHKTALDEVILFIDTSLEEFGNWMSRIGSSEAAKRINTDLTASTIQLQQIQRPTIQSKLPTMVRRVEVRHSVTRFHGRLRFYIFFSR